MPEEPEEPPEEDVVVLVAFVEVLVFADVAFTVVLVILVAVPGRHWL